MKCERRAAAADNRVVKACGLDQRRLEVNTSRMEEVGPSKARGQKRALIEPDAPLCTGGLPRSHRDAASTSSGRESAAVAGVMLGVAGLGVFAAGGAPLQQVVVNQPSTPRDPAAAGSFVTGAARVNPNDADARRALYTTYTRGGSAAIGERAVTPVALGTNPIERAGSVTEYPPAAKSNGMKVYFLYGFRSSTFDQTMASVHRSTIDDDIAAARAKGYTVIVDRAATSEDVARAMYDPTAAGLVWVGHGAKGGFITTSDDGFLRSGDLDASRISARLKFVVLQACHANEDPGWSRIFGGAQVVPFEGKTRWFDVLDFNRPNGSVKDYFGGNPIELDDLIRTKL